MKKGFQVFEIGLTGGKHSVSKVYPTWLGAKFDHKLELASSIQFDFEGTIKILRSLFPNSIGVEFNVM